MIRTSLRIVKNINNFKCFHKRYLLVANSQINLLNQNGNVKREDTDIFKSYYPEVVEDLTIRDPLFKGYEKAMERFEKCLDYNVNSCNKPRGTSILTAYKSFEKPENLTEERLKMACMAGWSYEMLCSFYLMTDDIEENSKIRNGKPCWHTLEGIGLSAVLDLIYLEQSVFTLLEIHLRKHQQYHNILSTIKTQIGYTIIGQQMDATKHPIDHFSWDLYHQICSYKTVSHSTLQFLIALHLANIDDTKTHEEVKKLTREFNMFAQIQNDYMDVYGDFTQTGKFGSDIQTGKVTWLAVSAWEAENEKDRNIMRKHYGINCENDVEIVKELFDKLGIPEKYRQSKQDFYSRSMRKIKESSMDLPKEVFEKSMLDLLKIDNVEIIT